MKKRGAVFANRVFLLSILCAQFLIYGFVILGVSDIMALQFITEVLLVLPGVVFLLMQRKSIRESIGVRKISVKQLLLLIPIAICIDKIAELFNLLSQLFTQNEVGGYMADLVVKYPFLIAFFVIAVEPAVCEELVYRGVVYQGYRRGRILTAALVSALLFGLMHMNLNQFVYAFVIGVLFALVNEAVGSIVPSVLIHVYINGRSVVLLYVVINFLKELHNKYIAAELAGDTKTMELLKELSEGLPIQSENWLEEYLNSGTGEVVTMLPYTIVTSVIAVIVLFFLIRALARISGREEHLKAIFRQKQTAPAASETVSGDENPVAGGVQAEEQVSGFYFVTPSLVIGVLICVVMMFL